MGIVKMSDDQMLHPIAPAVNKNHLPEDVRHVDPGVGTKEFQSICLNEVASWKPKN